MNPQTGEFHKEGPEEWPRFAVGERFKLRGVVFEIARINQSSLVLRPVSVDGLSAHKIIRRIVK